MREHRRFDLVRESDPTGLSGTGVVAQGVEFGDRTVVLRWTGAWPTSVVWHDKGVESVEAIHGHGGLTAIKWLDRPETTADVLASLETARRNGRLDEALADALVLFGCKP